MNTAKNWVIAGGWIAVALLGRHSDWPFTPILPSVCALSLVFVFRSALLGLAGGALVGALLIAPSAITAPVYLLSDLLLPALQSRWNICVLMFTLALVAVVIHRNWNPVAVSSPEVSSKRLIGDDSPYPFTNSSEISIHNPAMHSVLFPLLFLVTMLPFGLWWSGRHTLADQADVSWVDTFAAADTALILVLVGLGACLIASLVYPRTAPHPSGEAFIRGMERMLAPVLILIAAWALSGSLKDLHAGDWIGSILSGTVPNWFLPSLVFLAGATISFLTGTSWGTMGILVPLVIPLGVSAGAEPGTLGALGTSVLAAAFSGAVFGDHCSPISDTTIVSSLAAGVEPFDHVRTQLPYALTAAGLAVFPGFILAGFTGLLWPGLLAGAVSLSVIWYFLGLRYGAANT